MDKQKVLNIMMKLQPWQLSLQPALI